MKLSFLFILTTALFSCSDKQTNSPTPPMQTLPVLTLKSSAATTFQEYPAAIEGNTDVEIRPQVSGILDKLFVEEGAFVTAGTPLFKINDAPYREKLNNAKANLLAAKGSQTNAAIEVEKLKPLVANKVVAEYQLKTAESILKIAQANVEQAQAGIATAQINLGYTLIKAPFSGYISRLKKKGGSIVSPSDPEALTELSDVHNVNAYFSLAENDFVNFKEQYPGATLEDKITKLPPVTLVLGNNKEYSDKGRIDAINGKFDINTGAITIRANFPNTKGLLRSGNTGRVRLELNHTDVLLVPQSATLELQDKIFVFLLTSGNKVKRQPITVTGKSGEDYIVTDGLNPGDKIVLEGIGLLKEEMVINPVAPAKLTALHNSANSKN